MNVTDLRAAVTLNGGSPASYDRIALLRQLVTAYGGTPTQYSRIGLLREAVTAAGGTPTQFTITELERELLTALGASATNFDGRVNSALIAATVKGGTPTPTPTPTPSYDTIRFIGGRGQLNNATFTAGSGNAFNGFKSRRLIPIMADCDQIAVAYSNFIITTAGENTSVAVTTITKVSAELVSGGIQPVLFSASRGATMAAGDTILISDYLPASAFGLSKFTKGDSVWITTLGSIPAAATLGVCTESSSLPVNGAFSGERYCRFTPGAAGEDDVDTPGAKALPTGGANTSVFHPVGLLGRTVSTTKSVVHFHDSIGDGYNDRAEAAGGGGFMRRAANNAGLPFFQIGLYGITTQQWGASTKAKAILALGYFNRAVVQRGINDITGAATLATMQSRLAGIWTDCRNAGCQVHQLAMSTKATMGNYRGAPGGTQTPSTGCSVGGVRDQLNAWFPSQIGPSGITSYTDIYASFADAANKWVEPSAARTWTLNGGRAAFATSFSLASSGGSTAPVVGEALVFEPGLSTSDAAYVASVTGSGPWTVVVEGEGGTSGNYTGQVANAHSTATAVYTSNAPDGGHPAPLVHKAIAEGPLATLYAAIAAS